MLFLIVLFPVYYGLVGSLMGERDTNSFPPALYPKNGLHPDNYSNALDIIPLGNQYLTSVLQTLGITLGQMVTSALAAYAFVFLNLRWRGFWFAVFLSTMMIPFESIIIPNYLLISQWGLKDTIAGLTLPFLATGFGTFLLRQSFLSFPMELRDAARVDGRARPVLSRSAAASAPPASLASVGPVGLEHDLAGWRRDPITDIRSAQHLQSSDSIPGCRAGVMLSPSYLRSSLRASLQFLGSHGAVKYHASST